MGTKLVKQSKRPRRTSRSLTSLDQATLRSLSPQKGLGLKLLRKAGAREEVEKNNPAETDIDTNTATDTATAKILNDFTEYLGGVSKEEYVMIRTECGCITCDCDALSQDSYHKGCHTFGLFDQENDMTNSSESGGFYDEAEGFKPAQNQQQREDFEFFPIVVK